jgi:hypothetical protein
MRLTAPRAFANPPALDRVIYNAYRIDLAVSRRIIDDIVPAGESMRKRRMLELSA